MLTQTRNSFGAVYVLFFVCFTFEVFQIGWLLRRRLLKLDIYIIFSNNLLYRTRFKNLNNLISLKCLFIAKANLLAGES